MQKTLTSSESVIGNLCHEIAVNSYRKQSLLISINTCNNHDLYLRQNRELEIINQRSQEILQLASSWKRNKSLDQLSIKFLIEITNRSLSKQINLEQLT